MRKRFFAGNERLTKLVVIFALIGTALACGFSASTANISEATLARDYEGSQPTTTFAPDDNFYCIVELANAPDDTVAKAIWTAVSVEGYEPNLLIDEYEITSGSGTVHFSLESENLWPAGSYKVDLYLNGELVKTLTFEVA